MENSGFDAQARREHLRTHIRVGREFMVEFIGKGAAGNRFRVDGRQW